MKILRQLKSEISFRKNISRYFIKLYHESLIKWKISSRYFIDIFIKSFKFDINNNWQNPWSSIFVNILMKMMKNKSKKSSISANRSENCNNYRKRWKNCVKYICPEQKPRKPGVFVIFSRMCCIGRAIHKVISTHGLKNLFWGRSHSRGSICNRVSHFLLIHVRGYYIFNSIFN